jgi:hypothetical protein
LGEALLATDCALHAYVLMDNHVHAGTTSAPWSKPRPAASPVSAPPIGHRARRARCK